MNISGIDLDFQHTWTYQMYEGMRNAPYLYLCFPNN